MKAAIIWYVDNGQKNLIFISFCNRMWFVFLTLLDSRQSPLISLLTPFIIDFWLMCKSFMDRLMDEKWYYLLGFSAVDCSYYTCSSIKSSVHNPQQDTAARQAIAVNNNNKNQTSSENSKANLTNFLNKIKSKEPEGGGKHSWLFLTLIWCELWLLFLPVSDVTWCSFHSFAIC